MSDYLTPKSFAWQTWVARAGSIAALVCVISPSAGSVSYPGFPKGDSFYSRDCCSYTGEMDYYGVTGNVFVENGDSRADVSRKMDEARLFSFLGYGLRDVDSSYFDKPHRRFENRGLPYGSYPFLNGTLQVLSPEQPDTYHEYFTAKKLSFANARKIVVGYIRYTYRSVGAHFSRGRYHALSDRYGYTTIINMVDGQGKTTGQIKMDFDLKTVFGINYLLVLK